MPLRDELCNSVFRTQSCLYIRGHEGPCSYASPGSLSPGIDATLAERGSRYGEFKDHADISQMLKHSMQSTPAWENLPAHMREALEMIQHKIARILNGDPTYKDSWTDIIGYATLVEKDLT